MGCVDVVRLSVRPQVPCTAREMARKQLSKDVDAMLNTLNLVTFVGAMVKLEFSAMSAARAEAAAARAELVLAQEAATGAVAQAETTAARAAAQAPTITFPNLRPETLSIELKLAERLKIQPLRVTDPGFSVVANAGRVKWAVLESGELVMIPHTVNVSGASLELSHTVLSGGRPVLAAGEGSILARPNNITVRLLNRHTGHFETTAESLQIGCKAFEAEGISVLRIDPAIPR